MSDPPPPLPPPWPSDPPKERGAGQWLLTASGTIILILTLCIGAPVMLVAGCILLLSGDKGVGQIVAFMIGLVVLGGGCLWFGLRRPRR
jgi:hypothetical protein